MIEAELPGIRREDLDISVSDGEIAISGKRVETEPEAGAIHRRERVSGELSRRLRLNTPIDAGKVSATLENGILTLTLPKAESARPRKIAVSAK